MTKALRKFLLLLLIIPTGGNVLWSQINYNLELLSHPADACSRFNDVWGFQHSNGKEYAVLGTQCGTSIYDLTDPTLPVLVSTVTGAFGTWRDMKNWGDHIYVVADQGTFGLQVIDMSDPGSVRSWLYKPVIAGDTLQKAHNLYIDDMGFVYIAGSNRNAGGVLIFDLVLDDSIPPLAGLGPSRYAHDVYVNEPRNLMITSDINHDVFTLHELTRSPGVVSVNTIAAQETALFFTHNAWTTDDGNILFTTDELPGAFVEAWDISDPDAIVLLDQYKPFSTYGSNVTPHNVHVKGNHLIISYYRDGVKLVDASRPGNLVEIGGYDTEPSTGSGCWGAFPFFDSDLVLASDINHGLFVLQPDYMVQPAYLEGVVKDEGGTPIDSAHIQVTYDNTFEYSKNNGSYATGVVDQTSLPVAASNLIQVTVSKSGYTTKDTMINFIPGTVINQDFILQGVTLPVELISFRVISKECSNLVEWEVGSVVNHSHFEVESSEDGILFTNLVNVHPQDAEGTLYQYTDANSKSDNYYRLRQVDIDGKTSYSKVINSINPCASHDERLVIYPNPVMDKLYYSSSGEFHTVNIMTLEGKILQTIKDSDQVIDLIELKNGMYLIEFLSTEGSLTRKFIKI